MSIAATISRQGNEHKISMIVELIGKLFYIISDIKRRFINKYKLSKFKKHGLKCYLDGSVVATAQNISLGDNVYIGPGATLLSSEAEIKIGSSVMLGPNVTIVTGTHRIDVVGKNMIDVKDKRSIDDEDVIIEDDVWIGAGAIILKGVTISKGSVIAAGTMVTKSTPPYSVVRQRLERVERRRFSEDDLREHIRLLREKE